MTALPRRVKLIFSSFAQTYRGDPWAARWLHAVTRTPLKRGGCGRCCRGTYITCFAASAPTRRRPKIGSMVAVAQRLDPDMLWEQLGGYLEYRDSRGERVSTIASEAERLLILQGAKDDVQFPPAGARSCRLRHRVVPDAAHLLMTDNPTAVAQEVVDFL